MKLLGNRLFICLGVLLFLGVDGFAGRYLFGEAKWVVEILSIFFLGFFMFYWAISDERAYRKHGPELDKRKRALLALVREKEQKLKDFKQRKKGGKP